MFVLFVYFFLNLFFKSRALLTRALRGALSTQATLEGFDFNKTIYLTTLGASLAGIALSVPPADGLSPRIHVKCCKN